MKPQCSRYSQKRLDVNRILKASRIGFLVSKFSCFSANVSCILIVNRGVLDFQFSRFGVKYFGMTWISFISCVVVWLVEVCECHSVCIILQFNLLVYYTTTIERADTNLKKIPKREERIISIYCHNYVHTNMKIDGQ